MKTAIICLTLALCLQNGVLAGRSLQQLPTLNSAGQSLAPAPAPVQGGCALAALQQSGNFTTLISLIQAASESSTIQNLLSSPTELATVFAPTNGGIQKTLQQKGITQDSLLANPSQITNVLELHILPSQLQVGDLQDGFAFNTLYETNGNAQSVAVQGNGLTATIKAAGSSAPIISTLNACQFRVFPIDGLLLPQ